MKGRKREGTGSLLHKGFRQQKSELVKKDVYSEAEDEEEASSEEQLA